MVSEDSSDSERPWIPLRDVVARNAARLREEFLWVTQREVAEEITRLGMPWSAARYGRLEAAEVTPTLPVLVLVAAAFDAISSRRGVGERNAVGHHQRGTDPAEPIELTENCALPAGLLTSALMEPEAMRDVRRELIIRPERSRTREPVAYTLTDWRVAAALGVSREEMVELCEAAWGRTLTQERDARLVAHGVDPATASNTLKGRVAAELREVLQAALNEKRGWGTGPAG